jgi:hypothetical protein
MRREGKRGERGRGGRERERENDGNELRRIETRRGGEKDNER